MGVSCPWCGDCRLNFFGALFYTAFQVATIILQCLFWHYRKQRGLSSLMPYHMYVHKTTIYKRNNNVFKIWKDNEYKSKLIYMNIKFMFKHWFIYEILNWWNIFHQDFTAIFFEFNQPTLQFTMQLYTGSCNTLKPS
jgi:hypothetical protein